jgi:predicted nuclease with TOPRIM domain
MSGNHNKYQGESMTALQIWLQNHNRRLTQDAIDEALMEYIEYVDRQLAQHKAVIAAQNGHIERLESENAQLKAAIALLREGYSQMNKDWLAMQDLNIEQKEVIATIRNNVEALHNARDLIRSECNEQAATIAEQKEVIEQLRYAKDCFQADMHTQAALIETLAEALAELHRVNLNNHKHDPDDYENTRQGETASEALQQYELWKESK